MLIWKLFFLPVSIIQAYAVEIEKTQTDSVSYWYEETERLWSARNYKLCLHSANHYLQLSEIVTQPANAALIARRASRSALNLGQFEEALQKAFLGLQWADLSKDPNLVAFQYADIAVIYHDFEEYENGVRYGKEGLSKAKFIGADTKHQAYILNGIAINFDDWGKPDSALYYHYKVLNLSPLPDSLDIQFTFNNIGNTLLKTKRLKEAEPFFWTSIHLAKRRDNFYNQSSSFTNLGQLYQHLGKNEEADRFFDSALVYAKLANSIEKLRDTYLDRSNFHKAIGEFQLALENKELYLQLRDSIYQIERLKTFSELEAQYQGKIKDQQIIEQEQEILLRKANFNRIVLISSFLFATIIFLTIIHFLNQNRFKKKQLLLEKEKEIQIKEVAINAALASQEEEKKRFAKDLHDGFGQLITSLKLRLHQLEHTNELESKVKVFEESEQLLNEMHQEIRQIAFNMMPETLVKHGLIPALKEFSSKINLLNALQIKIDAFEINDRLSEIQEISLYRIIQEWINNSLKYGSAKKMEVQLIRDEEEIRLMIEDDGDGFDTSQLTNSAGYGWKNIQSRVNILKGSIELDSQKGRKGNILLLYIPTNNYTSKSFIHDATN
ncbi:tetratricopeptide repeat-containing sensor histidine kinase [Mongoliitalea lutea]|uniref:histidine kinase n=1 Tax=Mongoliitalea lutea TaxID=849756 RepID=A0A8J3CYZ1_9BACT|nr:tetratricopeptide repeat-containing sensor histidine kinase [Mongoliitalea lutea]GHB44791.1 hypothetical protein GCM10008106_27340 [Mongoliitalea lutea]